MILNKNQEKNIENIELRFFDFSKAIDLIIGKLKKSQFNIFNIFFAGFLFRIIDLVGVAAISKQLVHYFMEKN